MSIKKPDIYDFQKRLRRDAYDRASSIRERFPTLISLVISMTFKNCDCGSVPTPQEHKFSQESKAFFDFECPYIECVSGGFNISEAVSDLVDNNGNEASGEITCQGWQDKERIHKHRCLLRMQYKIIASYKTA